MRCIITHSPVDGCWLQLQLWHLKKGILLNYANLWWLIHYSSERPLTLKKLLGYTSFRKCCEFWWCLRRTSVLLDWNRILLFGSVALVIQNSDSRGFKNPWKEIHRLYWNRFLIKAEQWAQFWKCLQQLPIIDFLAI